MMCPVWLWLHYLTDFLYLNELCKPVESTTRIFSYYNSVLDFFCRQIPSKQLYIQDVLQRFTHPRNVLEMLGFVEQSEKASHWDLLWSHDLAFTSENVTNDLQPNQLVSI